jgi:hypothetical protein
MLRDIYGEVILKKGCILYHTSDEPFIYRPEKPMLFCTFHPSEYGMIGDYVTIIKLKKDISILFMIEDIKKARIYSSLSTYIDHKYGNLAKRNNNELHFFKDQLKKENFEGWFSSIENKGTVECAIINNTDLYKAYKSKLLKYNWKNGNINNTLNNTINNTVNIKNWGKYSISFIKKPIILNINIRFKKMIERYIDFEIDSKLINQYIFQMILKNAIIKYHDIPYQKINWNVNR